MELCCFLQKVDQLFRAQRHQDRRQVRHFAASTAIPCWVGLGPSRLRLGVHMLKQALLPLFVARLTERREVVPVP